MKHIKTGIKKTTIIFAALFCSLCIFCTSIIASVNGDLHNYFDNLGYMSNTTAPAAYQGQAAGYYTGGSLFLRNQVDNAQLISVELPDFKGGCSGIDMYLGAFSVINNEALLKMMKNILSSGGAYAMDLALTTTLPQVRSVKDYLQKYITEINSANINSCNVSEDLVGGLWPKAVASQQQICRDIDSHNGPASDWASARQACGVGGDFNSVMQAQGYESEKIVNKNLVWDALMHNAFTANDSELAEVLMSLSGSVIVKVNGNNKPSRVLLPSLADANFLKGLLQGRSQIKVYRCDETQQCLNPTIELISIDQTAGLVKQVEKIILALNTAVLSDSGTLTPETRGFLEMTPIPILKIISLEASLGQPLDTVQYSEVIALSLLNQYLMSDIKLVKESLRVEDTPLNPLMESRLQLAAAEISREINVAYKDLHNTQLIVTNLKFMEQQLASRVISQSQSGEE